MNEEYWTCSHLGDVCSSRSSVTCGPCVSCCLPCSLEAGPQHLLCVRPHLPPASCMQTASGHPTILQTAQMTSGNNRVNPSGTPLNFPPKVVKPTHERSLKHDDSIRSQEDDPEMATQLNLGSICNTVVAQYEFKSLEFARPTRMVRFRTLHSTAVTAPCSCCTPPGMFYTLCVF
jgi:hypothetical protein